MTEKEEEKVTCSSQGMKRTGVLDQKEQGLDGIPRIKVQDTWCSPDGCCWGEIGFNCNLCWKWEEANSVSDATLPTAVL